MDQSKHLFFIALLPPLEIQQPITQIKQYFAEQYGSKQALKSPPHITLQPPFEWPVLEIPRLENCLAEFATHQFSIPVTLSGFAAFPPRVIYVNVIKTPALLAIHQNLAAYLEPTLGIIDPATKTRPFSPHITVAFRDLTRQNFKLAWPEFEHQSLNFEFTASQLTLLIHDGRGWQIHREFPLSSTE